jgi:hypothetical protein
MSENKLRISVIDQRTGTKTQVRVPTNAPTNKLIPALVKTLGMPTEGPGGAPQQYYLALEDAERTDQLDEDETLEQAGVQEGAVLRIMPQMTGGASGKVKRFFTLYIKHLDGETFFQTDFSALYFDQFIKGLVSQLVRREVLFSGELYNVRIIPGNDHTFHNKTEVVLDDPDARIINNKEFISLHFSDGQTQVDNITYLTFRLQARERSRVYGFDMPLDVLLTSMLNLVVQAMVDENLLQANDIFEYGLSAREGTDFELNPLLTKHQTLTVEVPSTLDIELSNESELMESHEPILIAKIETGPLGGLQIEVPRRTKTARWSQTEDTDSAIEVEVESVEYLITPTPKSVDSYQDIELIGQKIESGDLPIYFRRGAWKLAHEAANVSKQVDEEVGGFLIGNAHRDPATNQLFVEIAGIVVADQAQGTAVSIDFNYSAWRQVIEKLKTEFPDKISLGWYHTHLSSQLMLVPLSVEQNRYQVKYMTFFSQADRFVHRSFFPDQWHVALVIDLKRKEDVFFVWRNGKIVESKGYYLYGD